MAAESAFPQSNELRLIYETSRLTTSLQVASNSSGKPPGTSRFLVQPGSRSKTSSVSKEFVGW